MAAATTQDVRDILHVSDTDFADKVLKMIKRAEVMLEMELSVDLHYTG